LIDVYGYYLLESLRWPTAEEIRTEIEGGRRHE